jgi:hypothetical protein
MKLYFGPNTDKPVTAALDVQGYLEEDKKHQYQDGYSMAEAAKSWVSAGGYLPESIAAIVGSNDLNVAHFEFPTKVWGGGTAMTDVMAFIPNGVIAKLMSRSMMSSRIGSNARPRVSRLHRRTDEKRFNSTLMH